MRNFSSNWQLLLFGSDFWPKKKKKKFWPKTEKVNISIEFSIFKLVSWYQISVFTNNFDFLTRFLQKSFFSALKQRKWATHTFYIIVLIQISLVRNFSSNWQFWFSGPNLPKKGFSVENRKSEHRHGILHIWTSLVKKFQLKLIILSFWTKFTKKSYFELKTEQAGQGLVFTSCTLNGNSAVVFEHFEGLKDLIILNILKEKLVIACLMGSLYLKIV